MSHTDPFGGEFVWQSTPDYVENTHLTHFIRREGIASFDELMRRSSQNVA